MSGAGGYAVNPKQELKLNDPQFRLDQFFPNYGYLLLTVEPGTLRIEFHSPDLKGGAAADTCIVDLAQHRVQRGSWEAAPQILRRSHRDAAGTPPPASGAAGLRSRRARNAT